MTISKEFRQKLVVELERISLNVFEDLLPIYVGNFSLEKTRCSRSSLRPGINTVQAFYLYDGNDDWAIHVVYSLGKAIAGSLLQKSRKPTSKVKDFIINDISELDSLAREFESFYIKQLKLAADYDV